MEVPLANILKKKIVGTRSGWYQMKASLNCQILVSNIGKYLDGALEEEAAALRIICPVPSPALCLQEGPTICTASSDRESASGIMV